MKKLSNCLLFAATVLCVLFSTNSCVTNPPLPDDGDSTEIVVPDTLAYANATFIGSAVGSSVEHYVISLTTADLFALFGQYIGDGELLNIYLLQDPTGEIEISEGTYKIKPVQNNNFEAGTVLPGIVSNGQALGTVVYEVNESQIGEPMCVTDGEVTVKKIGDKYEIRASLTVDGKERDFIYYDNITVTDGTVDPNDPTSPYMYEHAEVSTENYTYTDVLVENYGSANDKSEIFVTLSSDTLEAVFVIYTDENPSTVNGTYILSDSQEKNTSLKSPGMMMETETALPAYAKIKSTDGFGFKRVYFLVDGSITIDDNGVSFETTSYNGSTINGSYSGKVTTSF